MNDKFDILYESFMTEMLFKNRWKPYHLVVESIKDKLLPNPVWIYDSKSSNILTEDRKVFSSIAKNIFNAKNGTVFSAKHILEHTPNFDINDGEYANIPIVKYAISFKSNEQLKTVLSKHKKDIPQQYRNFVLNTFDTNSNSNGLFLASYTMCIIVLNKEKSDILTVQHELYHYCQFLSGLNVIESISKFDKNKIKNLQLSNSELTYLLAPHEFLAHIDIDLKHQCKAIHKKYYTNISYNEFIDKLINEIKVSKDKFMMSDIGIKFTRIFSFDTSAIRLFVAAFCLELKYRIYIQLYKIINP